MPAYKDNKTGTWFVKFYCKDWTGENKQIKKRGFATKREALDYERNYKIRQENNLDMTFGKFWKLYTEDVKPRVKLNTWLTKWRYRLKSRYSTKGDRRAYQQAKERYEHQRNGLEKKYKAKTVEFDTMIVVLWWYVIVTTIFAAIRSETFLGDFTVFVDTVWNGICQSGKWIVDVGNALAQAGDRIPNETMAIVAHWLLFIIVIVGAAVAVGVLMVIGEKKVTKVYRENCWDVISVGEAVTSVALVVYFGDWIKAFVKLNLVVLLLLVQAVYVGIRAYVKGCKRARGYY